MLKKDFVKIKEIGLYFFAAVGIIAILLFIIQASLPIYRYGRGGGEFSALRSTPVPGSEELIAEGTADQAQQISEGELTQRKIIKNGSLSLLVQKAEEAVNSIQGIAKDLEGFVSSSYIYEVTEGVKSGTITIRIPANRFDEAMGKIKELAVKVEREGTDTQDVTEEFIDLEARLKNLRAEEEQYLEIMERAVTVEDTLKVSQRLSDVRGRIERIEGQLQYLSRQVDMSTITVYLTSEAEVQVFGIHWRPLIVVKQSFRNMLTGLTGYVDSMVRFIFALPVIALWLGSIALFLIGGWWLVRWIRRKFFLRK